MCRRTRPRAGRGEVGSEGGYGGEWVRYVDCAIWFDPGVGVSDVGRLLGWDETDGWGRWR